MSRCARAAWCEPLGPDPYAEHREALKPHEQSFGAGQRIVRRISRIVRRWSAPRLPASKAGSSMPSAYTKRAITSARANSFVHNEALANELAARFYAARGFEKIAHAVSAETRGTATCAGGPTARCGSWISSIRG